MSDPGLKTGDGLGQVNDPGVFKIKKLNLADQIGFLIVESVDAETFVTDGGQVNTTIGERLEMHDARRTANRVRCCQRRHRLASLLDQGDAKGEVFTDTLLQHQAVAFLKDIEMNWCTRKKNSIQGK